MNPFSGLVGQITEGLLRHVITSVAGGFVAQGLINQNQAQTLIAGAMVAAGIGLSLYSKGAAANREQVALMTPPPAPPET